MFLCGNVDAAAQEQPNAQRTLSSVARAIVSIPEAVLVNEFASGENAGVVYYVGAPDDVQGGACSVFILPCRLFVRRSETSLGSFAGAIATFLNCTVK